MRPLTPALGLIVLAASLLAGCGLSPDEHPDPYRLSTWQRVDASWPAAGSRMRRIGHTGPSRLDPRGPVVVNFWLSSCGPCRKEMPLLERLSRSGFPVVGVNRDAVPHFARAELRRRGVTFPNYSDASGEVMFGLRDVLYPDGVPTTVILRDGRVRWVHIGRFTSYTDLQRSVAERMAP